MRHKHLGKHRLFSKKSLDFIFSNLHDCAIAHGNGCCKPLRLSDQTSFAKELICAEECDDCLLALLGYDDYFDFALFDIEHRVRGIALRKDDRVLLMCRNAPAASCGFKKKPQIE